MNLLTLLGLLAIMATTVQGQSVQYDLYTLCVNDKLDTVNREVTPFKDQDIKGIRFSANDGEGIAWLEGAEFSNGIIEVDIRGKDVMQKSFVGVAFHGANNKTFDAVYFRPFNFRSEDPARRVHAVQYISHPDFTWFVLRQKYPGKYENAITPAPDGNEWFHAAIKVQYPKVTVYVNGNDEPSLNVDKLNERKTGKIGLWVGMGSDGDFANLRITRQE